MNTSNQYIFFAMLIMPFLSIAQSRNTDEIYLINSEKYRGTVIEQKPGEYIRMLLENGNDTLTFKMEDIDKITKLMGKEAGTPPSTLSNEHFNLSPLSSTVLHKRFNTKNISPMLHYGAGGGDIAFNMLGFSIFYRLNSKFQTGFSANYYGETGSLRDRPMQWQKVPITIEFIHDLQQYNEGRSALVTRFGIGYSFTLNGDFVDPEKIIPANQSNGLVINPGIGYRYNLLNNIGLMLDLSYHLIKDKNVNELNEIIGKNNWDNVVFRGTIFF